MGESNGMLSAIGFSVASGGLWLVWMGSLGNKIKIVLTGLLVMVLGAAIFFHPFWGIWRLSLQNLVSSGPTWAWVIIGAWIYLNAGWRFAEYKLRVAARGQTINPLLLHLLWPESVAVADDLHINNPKGSWFDNNGIKCYKIWSTILFGIIVMWNLTQILTLWLIWLATIGRLKPIHPEIWKMYHDGTQ